LGLVQALYHVIRNQIKTFSSQVILKKRLRFSNTQVPMLIHNLLHIHIYIYIYIYIFDLKKKVEKVNKLI